MSNFSKERFLGGKLTSTSSYSSRVEHWWHGKEAYLKKKITELKESDEFIKEKSEKVFETPNEIESGEKEVTKSHKHPFVLK